MTKDVAIIGGGVMGCEANQAKLVARAFAVEGCSIECAGDAA